MDAQADLNLLCLYIVYIPFSRVTTELILNFYLLQTLRDEAGLNTVDNVEKNRTPLIFNLAI